MISREVGSGFETTNTGFILTDIEHKPLEYNLCPQPQELKTVLYVN